MFALLLSSITLDSLIKVALESSPYIKAAEGRRLAIEALGYQAGRLSNPELFSRFSSNETAFGISQRLSNPLLLNLERNLWKNELERTNIELDRESFEYVIALKENYIEAVLSKFRILVIEESIDSLQKLLDKVDKGHRNGKFPLSHVLNLKTRLEHLKGELSIERTRFRNYLSRLSVLSGVQVDSISMELPIPGALSIEESTSMLDSSFTIREKGAIIKGTILKRKNAIASLFPGLDIELAHVREYPANSIFEVGISLPIPIWNLNRGKVKYFDYMEKALRSDSLFTANALHEELSSLTNEFLTLSRRIEKIEKKEIPLLTEAFNNSRIMYINGKVSYLEVMDAFERLVEKKMERIDYMGRMYEICFRIERILGRCIKEEGK